MSKKSQPTIQIIVLILVILGIGYYFLNEFYLSKNKTENQNIAVSLDQIFEFKVVRSDLTQEQINKYQSEFNEDVKRILASPDKFNFDALNGMAMIKKILYDFEGARDAWEYISIMRPKNSLSFFNLGNLYAEEFKDNQKAEYNFLKCLENSEGESGNEQYYRGIVNFYTYYYPERKEQIEKILLEILKTEQYKKSQDVLALLATYYQNNNQNNKALEYWQKVLELDPENEVVKEEIERLKK